MYHRCATVDPIQWSSNNQLALRMNLPDSEDQLRRPLSGREVIGHTLPLILTALFFIALFALSNTEIIRKYVNPWIVFMAIPVLWIGGEIVGGKLLRDAESNRSRAAKKFMFERILQSRAMTIVAWVTALIFTCAAIASWLLLVAEIPDIDRTGYLAIVTIVFAIPPILRVRESARNMSSRHRRNLLWGSGIFVAIVVFAPLQLPIICHQEAQSGNYYHCESWRDYSGHRSE